MRFPRLLAAAALAASATLAQATYINSSFFNSAGNTWIGQFTVTNDGSVPLIESFTIFFDYGKATNLTLMWAPSWWDTIVVQPDDVLQAAGYLDALQVDPSLGLAPGSGLKGFSVQFDWSGADAPGPFAYSVNDPVTYASIETGRTDVPGGGGSPALPEPASLALLLAGLAGAAATRRQATA